MSSHHHQTRNLIEQNYLSGQKPKKVKESEASGVGVGEFTADGNVRIRTWHDNSIHVYAKKNKSKN